MDGPAPVWQTTGSQAPSPRPVGLRETAAWHRQLSRPRLGDGQRGTGCPPSGPTVRTRTKLRGLAQQWGSLGAGRHSLGTSFSVRCPHSSGCSGDAGRGPHFQHSPRALCSLAESTVVMVPVFLLGTPRPWLPVTRCPGWPLSPGLPLPSQWAGSSLEGGCPGTPPPSPDSPVCPRTLGRERRGKAVSQTHGRTTGTVRGARPRGSAVPSSHPVPPGRCGPA